MELGALAINVTENKADVYFVAEESHVCL